MHYQCIIIIININYPSNLRIVFSASTSASLLFLAVAGHFENIEVLSLHILDIDPNSEYAMVWLLKSKPVCCIAKFGGANRNAKPIRRILPRKVNVATFDFFCINFIKIFACCLFFDFFLECNKAPVVRK